MSATFVTGCRICTADLPEPFLDLGRQPLANNLSKSRDAALVAPAFPLALTKCAECHSVQLTHTVDPEILFGEYLYQSGVSASLSAHFDDMATYMDDLFDEPGVMVDVGSNDGLLLEKMAALDWEAVGVEPAANLAAVSREKGFLTFASFLDEETAMELVEQAGKADLVTANNVFAHTGDLHGFLDGVQALLAEDGYFVFEVAYLPRMLADGTFDLIYHEHVFCHALTPLTKLLADHGMRAVKVTEVNSHGGSLRVYVQRHGEGEGPGACVRRMLATEREAGVLGTEVYEQFAKRVSDVRTTLRDTLAHYGHEGAKVIGYTCPAKAATLINYCGLTFADIDYIVDDSPLKQGRWLPAAAIPIVGGKVMEADKPDVVVVWAWNVYTEVIGKLPKGTTAIKPMPEVEVATA